MSRKAGNLSEASRRSLSCEENAGPEYNQSVKWIFPESSKVTFVQCQQDVSPRQCAKQNGAIFSHRKN